MDVTTINPENLTNYFSVDLDNNFAQRFSGTFILVKDEKTKVYAWQKNATSLMGQELVLPTIIELVLQSSMKVDDVILHDPFLGSKGEKCKREYLNENLKHQLIGMEFTNKNRSQLLTENLYCFHLTEVLCRALSIISLMKPQDNFMKEDEVLDFKMDGQDILYTSRQIFSNAKEYMWNLRFHDFKGSVKLDEEYCLSRLDTEFVFRSSDIVIKERIKADKEAYIFLSISRFLQRCVNALKDDFRNKNIAFYYSNHLFHKQLLGLIVQSLAKCLFPDNPGCFFKMLSNLQRRKRALCIGGLNDEEKIKNYFPLPVNSCV